jgi:putative phage-type endonuclease
MTMGDYHFPEEAYFREITVKREYEQLLLRDKAKEVRRSVKTLIPLCIECPYDARQQNGYRDMKQPSDEWLDARSRFLTSSRFGHIAGHQPGTFGSPLNYWREITGRVDTKPFTEQQLGYMHHGQKYEPVARAKYEEMNHVSCYEEGLRILQEPPWIYSASSDGLTENQPSKFGIIEIKCNAVNLPRMYTPEYYIPQVMGCMAVYNAPFCDFINYWARDEKHEDRFFQCNRIHFNEEYWKALKLRLDYMAWCVANDEAPTGMGEITFKNPLPDLVPVERCFKMSKAIDDDKHLKLLATATTTSSPQSSVVSTL